MDRARDFAELAIEKGIVAAQRVVDARRRQESLRGEGRRAFLAEVLIEAGILTPRRLVELLDECRGYSEGDGGSARLGDVAVRKGYCCASDVYQSLRIQRDEDVVGLQHRSIGEILLERRLLSPWELEDVLLTMAELTFSTTRSGDTPSEAFPVQLPRGQVPRGHGPRSSGSHCSLDVIPRTATLRAAVTRRTRPGLAVDDAMSAAVRIDVDARLCDARDAAWDEGSQFVMVMASARLVGVLDVYELQDVDGVARVSEFVVTDALLTVGPQTRVHDALEMFRWSGVDCLPVVESGEVKGVLTREDLRRAGYAAAEVGDPYVDAEIGGGD